MHSISYRVARPDDAAACINLRGRTRENAFSAAQLAELGITVDSWRQSMVDGCFLGHVCVVDGQIAGYCFGDTTSGEILVLALLPEYEGHGFGTHLLQRVVDELWMRGFDRLFLACSSDPAVRSHGFYRHLGWRATGETDDTGDEILERRRETDTVTTIC